jgi:hypothetical protein
VQAQLHDLVEEVLSKTTSVIKVAWDHPLPR